MLTSAAALYKHHHTMSDHVRSTLTLIRHNVKSMMEIYSQIENEINFVGYQILCPVQLCPLVRCDDYYGTKPPMKTRQVTTEFIPKDNNLVQPHILC